MKKLLLIILAVLMLSGCGTIYYESELLQKCKEEGGLYSVRDRSWEEDGSDYRADCILPEKELFEYPLTLANEEAN